MAARFVALLLLLAWLAPVPDARATPEVAPEPPVCAAARSGTVSCIGERLCRCGLQRGGSMRDEPASYRWDCGVLRPYCHRPPTSGERYDPLLGLDLVLPVPERRPPRPPHSRPRPKPADR